MAGNTGTVTTIPAPPSPLMSLAAHQCFTGDHHQDQPVMLTSFITICLADILQNHKSAMINLANFLQSRINHLLQAISNVLQQALHLKVVLEIQPTSFHHVEFGGWSLNIFMTASSQDYSSVRET